MSLDTSIEDLEVSVRCLEFLTGLGLESLRELVALPEIHAPKVVAAELQLLFDDLGVEFPGTFVVAEPVIVEATGDVLERWQTISDWLEENHPSVLETFLGPASEQAIAEVERALGRKLPDDYVRFLGLHGGQEDGGPMVSGASLFDVASLVSEYESLQRLFESEGEVDPDLCGEGVRPVEMSRGWIPIGRSGRGRDFLCLDLDPAPGGRVGQVVLVAVDFDDRPLAASSFADLLSLFFEQMQAGEIDLEDVD